LSCGNRFSQIDFNWLYINCRDDQVDEKRACKVVKVQEKMKERQQRVNTLWRTIQRSFTNIKVAIEKSPLSQKSYKKGSDPFADMDRDSPAWVLYIYIPHICIT